MRRRTPHRSSRLAPPTSRPPASAHGEPIKWIEWIPTGIRPRSAGRAAVRAAAGLHVLALGGHPAQRADVLVRRGTWNWAGLPGRPESEFRHDARCTHLRGVRPRQNLHYGTERYLGCG
ncbi:hypothetical protein EF912_26305 [Streptomyces sp. WAC07061]|nr:hypothetical protein EF912_26305 [Streptomyces sp. WAC07061]